MGDGNARTERLKLGLQIAAACVVVLIGAFAVGSAVAGPFFWYSCSLDGLEAHGPSQASILVSSDGTRLGLLGTTGARQPVALQRIRPVMRKAIIDTEDRRFYSNNGIDYVGIMRALKSDVSAGGIAQGGSTIEQQLVRNLYLTPQQSLSRKLTEACLAVELDKQWSKDRILTSYLNDIYFGQQAYGIEAAASAYFGVHAKDLTLEQAALLAGLPQAPSSYDPLNRPDAAKARRAEVLRAMLEAGDISQARYRRAVHSPLGLHPRQAPGLAGQTYLTDYITNQLVSEYGAERVRRGGLRIYTTLDAKKQNDATHAILGTLDRKGDPAGSVVSIDPKTGQIRAMAIAEKGNAHLFRPPGQRPEAGGIDVQDVRADECHRTRDQSVFHAIPLGPLRRARQLARPHVREHLLRPHPAHGGDRPLGQHRLRPADARPRPASRSPNSRTGWGSSRRSSPCLRSCSA